MLTSGIGMQRTLDENVCDSAPPRLRVKAMNGTL